MNERPAEKTASVAASTLQNIADLRKKLLEEGLELDEIDPSVPTIDRAKDNLHFINGPLAQVLNDFLDITNLTIDLGPDGISDGEIGYDNVIRFNSRYANKKVEWSSKDGGRRVALSDLLLDNYYLHEKTYRKGVVYFGNLTKEKILSRFEYYVSFFKNQPMEEQKEESSLLL